MLSFLIFDGKAVLCCWFICLLCWMTNCILSTQLNDYISFKYIGVEKEVKKENI